MFSVLVAEPHLVLQLSMLQPLPQPKWTRHERMTPTKSECNTVLLGKANTVSLVFSLFECNRVQRLTNIHVMRHLMHFLFKIL